MPRLFALVAIASGLLLTGAMRAQEKPDFSGVWILERSAGAATDVADELIVRLWAEQKLSVTGQPTPFDFIAIDRRVAGEIRSTQYQIGLAGGVVGGIDARRPVPPGQLPQTRFSRRWEGATLVMETASYAVISPDSAPYAENREEWSLDDGKLMVVVTTKGSTSAPTRGEFVYKRR